MIQFRCPKCTTLYRAPESLAGGKISCHQCGQRLQVPLAVEMRTLPGVPIQAPSQAKAWFFEQEGKRRGPVTEPDLENLAARGRLGSDDRVWSDGMDGWQPAGLVLPHLFSNNPVLETLPGINGPTQTEVPQNRGPVRHRPGPRLVRRPGRRSGRRPA